MRTLKIYHLHTREKAEIAYKKDGRYLPEGLRKLNYILRDWRRNEPIKMDPRLFDLIWAVYQKAGSNKYINVVCGYRAPETNSMLRRRSRGVAKKSQHVVGRALDFFIPGVSLRKLRELGLKMEVGGVGYYPTSGSPFVHMDVGRPRYWPRMSRRQLLALFPGGKTLYLPSDGKPLPGYAEALADFRARKGQAPDVEIASAAASTDDDSDIQVASAKQAPAKAGISRLITASLPSSGNDAAVVAGKIADQPATIVAALPHTAPLPARAPRPEADVGTDSAAERDSSAQLALNIPSSSSQPDYMPPPAPSVTPGGGQKAAVIDASHGHSGSTTDPVTATSSREGGLSDEGQGDSTSSGATVTLAAFTSVLPSARPDPNSKQMARLPTVRMDYEQGQRATVQPAVYMSGSGGRGGGIVAAKVSGSPRLALLEQPDAMSIATGARTIDKEARMAPGEGKPQPKSFAASVPQSIASWALQTGSFKEKIEGQKVRALAYNMDRAAPRIVYTAGFRPGDAGEDASHFTGSAVTFLPVAKFNGPE